MFGYENTKVLAINKNDEKLPMVVDRINITPSAFGGEDSRTNRLKKVRKILNKLSRSGWLVDAEGLVGEGDTRGQGGQCLEVRVHEIDPMEEAGGGPENNLVPWPGWWAEPYPGIN